MGLRVLTPPNGSDSVPAVRRGAKAVRVFHSRERRTAKRLVEIQRGKTDSAILRSRARTRGYLRLRPTQPMTANASGNAAIGSGTNDTSTLYHPARPTASASARNVHVPGESTPLTGAVGFDRLKCWPPGPSRDTAGDCEYGNRH